MSLVLPSCTSLPVYTYYHICIYSTSTWVRDCSLPRIFDPTVQIYLILPTFMIQPFITPVTSKIPLFRMNRRRKYSPVCTTGLQQATSDVPEADK
jgi:hypothetical protein